ncbi:hypothetical protein D3874_11935 [Oleomonas cavernae]|uniref:Uncharacterized protein n=1 Tax=Oleomonas cavernae TaxID=2320859 RepID=A0A418WC98_9PROT|nr:hypothetical protein [Oleomonas cavernae]RJF87642.1 hypothetical protein D3874_11935 [Oleomonas cavernae]
MSAASIAAALDRVVEIALGVGQQFLDLGDLDQRRRVVVADAGLPQGGQNQRMGIAFHRIEHPAGKAFEEGLGTAFQAIRMDAQHWVAGVEHVDDLIDRRKSPVFHAALRGAARIA